MSAGFAGRDVVGLRGLNIHMILEVRNKHIVKYANYLRDYIVYGLHLWYAV